MTSKHTSIFLDVKSGGAIQHAQKHNNMYTYHKFLLLAFLTASLSFTACGDDDTVIPQDEELINFVSIDLTPVAGGDVVIVTFLDADGDGALEPVIGTLLLDANTVYNANITLANQTVTPVEDITAEIKEEDEDHQLFFTTSNGLNLSVAYQDEDSDGNPLGLSTTFTTTDASTGELTVILRHEPNKGAEGVANGDITNAGGETDIEILFPVEIQ